MSKTYLISRFATAVADPVKARTYGQKPQEITEKNLARAAALYCSQRPDEHDGTRTLYMVEKPRNFAERILSTTSVTEVRALQARDYAQYGKDGVTLRAHFSITAQIRRKGKALSALLEREEGEMQAVLEAEERQEIEDAYSNEEGT